MSRILCSTGALIGRPNGRDYTLLRELCPQLKCDGLEFLMYDTWYGKEEAISSFFKSLPLPVVTFHLEKQIGELISHDRLNDALDRMEINCELAKSLGAELLVLHLWNGIISDKNISYNIDCYKYLSRIAEKYSLTLTVENVVCNQQDPLTHLRELVRHYPDIMFTYDTKMAHFHRQSEELYLKENRHLVPHIAHIHANDYGGGYKDWSNLRVLPIGQGGVDFDRFFSFLLDCGYRGDYTLEATCFNAEGKISLDGLNSSIQKIQAYLS
ncbi:MAG: sugar phosphate isomerase/epimerase [Clostridia bacterium]|nr:sugar phosphate isomerase/epimerase [Clostridia bacterium]